MSRSSLLNEQSVHQRHTAVGSTMMGAAAAGFIFISILVIDAKSANAVSPNGSPPAMQMMGANLFQREFGSGNPLMGSDGLGPLFNAASCVACHNQGGAGGSGDSRFNVKAVGIDRIRLEGNITASGVKTLAR